MSHGSSSREKHLITTSERRNPLDAFFPDRHQRAAHSPSQDRSIVSPHRVSPQVDRSHPVRQTCSRDSVSGRSPSAVNGSSKANSDTSRPSTLHSSQKRSASPAQVFESFTNLPPIVPYSSVANRKEFKIIYDPETSHDKSKGSSPIYAAITAETKKRTSRDPRKDVPYTKMSFAGKRGPYASLALPKFKYDDNSVGPKPPNQVLITGMSRLTTIGSVKARFKEFGKIGLCSLVECPDTGTSLGCCIVQYTSSIPDKAHQMALRAIQEGSGLKIDFKPIKVEFDEDGSKVAKELENQKARLRKQEEISREAHQRESKKQTLLSTKHFQGSGKSGDSRALEKPVHRRTSTQNDRVDSSDPQTYPDQRIKQIIGNNPFIFIKARHLPPEEIYTSEVKRALRDFAWTRVISDPGGFYILFDSVREAKDCVYYMDDTRLYEFRLVMNLHLPGSPMPSTRADSTLSSPFISDRDRQRPKRSEERGLSKNTDAVDEATDLIMKELRDQLLKNIRERIVTPQIFSSLNSYDNASSLRPAERSASPASNLSAQGCKVESIRPAPTESDDRHFLPSFRKKELLLQAMGKRTRRPMNHQLNLEDDEDGNRNDVSTPQDSNMATISPSPSVTDDIDKIPSMIVNEDIIKLEPRKPSADTFVHDDPENNIIDSEHDSRAFKRIKLENMQLSTPTETLQLSSWQAARELSVSWAPYEGNTAQSTCVDDDWSMPVGIEQVQSSVKDKEDLDLLREVFSKRSHEDYKDSLSSIGEFESLDEWAQFTKNLYHENAGSFTLPEDAGARFSVEPTAPTKAIWLNQRQSWRSRIYKKVSTAEKLRGLAQSRRLPHPVDTQSQNTVNSSVNTESKVLSSRLNRANNRRLANDINLQKQMLSNETDIFSFNQLKKRKKPVKFARSSIHNWGLYAVEPIMANEMIIEYVGEIVRQELADLRERFYLKSGIGSSYLFRIDDSTVVDATKKGGIARVIRSCIHGG